MEDRMKARDLRAARSSADRIADMLLRDVNVHEVEMASL